MAVRGNPWAPQQPNMTNVTRRINQSSQTSIARVGDPTRRRSVLLVVNPSASGVTARNRVVIQNALAAEHTLEVAETHRRGHATRFAQGAAARGFDVVISLGGDGTVNEVANGLVGTNTALGVLPGGSTNVFARQLGFTNDPEPATEELLSGLRTNNLRRIGLGNVNGRYFCFHVGMGFDAAVVAQVERFGTLKRWLGHPLFATAALHTWIRGYDRKRPAFSVEVAGRPKTNHLSSVKDAAPDQAQPVGTVKAAGWAFLTKFRPPEAAISVAVTDGFFAVALNLDPYTFLGSRPLSMTKDATLDRPLALVTLKTLKLAPTLKAVARAISGKGLGNLPGVEIRTDLHGFTVRGRRPFPWQVDGDYLGDTDLLEFSYLPDAISLVLPGQHR
jgi:diacylglycerol kinase family enzyme